MRILVACEESQAVTKELRRLGHEAYSCDIQDCSGGHPEWHIKGDALELLKMKWDMLIAFPPCTHLAVSGARHFAKKQADGRQQEAIDFFMRFVNADCPRIAVENPIGIMSSKYRKPNQIIQPYMFGDHARKSTCLWTKGLPPLVATDVVDPGEICKGGFSKGASADCARDENGKIIAWNDPRTAKIRSKTFPGIARAMAEQWAGICELGTPGAVEP
jgi:site-specific DNA-cytosine methylase